MKFLIFGFWREVDEICDLLGYYVAYWEFLTYVSGKPIGPISKGQEIQEDWTGSLPETSVTNYQYTLRNIPEQRRYRESSCSCIIVIKISNLTYAKLNYTPGRNRHLSSHLSESQTYLHLSACIRIHLQISVPTTGLR